MGERLSIVNDNIPPEPIVQELSKLVREGNNILEKAQAFAPRLLQAKDGGDETGRQAVGEKYDKLNEFINTLSATCAIGETAYNKAQHNRDNRDVRLTVVALRNRMLRLIEWAERDFPELIEE